MTLRRAGICIVGFMIRDPDYERWLRTVPVDITDDTLWRMTAYRYSLYAMAKSQSDVPVLARCRETRGLIDQLLRAVGGISANLEEGYSRSSGRERAHFYEYSLGSARESRGWYYKCAVALPGEILIARMSLLTQIVRILTVVVPEERASKTSWRAKREKGDGQALLDHPAVTNSSKE